MQHRIQPTLEAIWFSRLHERSARIIEKLSIRIGSQCFVIEEHDENDEGEAMGLRPLNERDYLLKRPEVRKWQSPKQLPISAETVFIDQFIDNPKRCVGKAGGPVTIYDAWDGLSLGELEHYTARAKRTISAILSSLLSSTSAAPFHLLWKIYHRNGRPSQG